MFIILIIVFLMILVLSGFTIYDARKNNKKTSNEVINFITNFLIELGVSIFVLSGFVVIYCIGSRISNEPTIDKLISYYQEENYKIGNDIKESVKQAVGNQKIDYIDSLSTECAVSIALAIPNSTPKELINSYIVNVNYLNSLTQEKNDIKTLKKILFFAD